MLKESVEKREESQVSFVVDQDQISDFYKFINYCYRVDLHPIPQ